MSEQLRVFIGGSEHSRYRIAKETGVSQSALSRFHSRRTTLSLEALNALAVFLGLELIQTAKPDKGARAPNSGGRTRR